MLENLVESKNNSRVVRKTYGFLLSTFFVVCTMLLSATVWSLFAKDFGVGNSDFELSNLVSPIPVADTKPELEPEKPKRQNEPQAAKSTLPSRQSVMAKIDEPQIVPDKTSVAPNTQKARPNSAFVVNPNARETDGSTGGGTGRNETGNNVPGFDQPTEDSEIVSETVKTKIPEPPPVLKKEEKPKTTIVSLGVINGKATSLPKPPYPPTAKAVGASGAVNVQVLIDETGDVVSAKAVNGHPLLRAAAERAARSAKFTPTKLSNIPVKVNGLIVYNFAK